MKKIPLLLTQRFTQSTLLIALLASCASAPVSSDRAPELRNKLTQLQSNPNLSPYASESFMDAERAVREVEKPQSNPQMTMHSDFVAETTIDIAEAKARNEYLINQRKTISQDTANARLAARTLEADQSAEDAAQANRKAAAYAAELEALKAKPSPKGMMITLGDVLFLSGRSSLNADMDGKLDKLCEFLNNNPQSKLLIVGHTDNVGLARSNLALSEMRANAVRDYLKRHGVSDDRMTSNGMGESDPIESNSSAEGRQQNRRVEITILNG